MSFVIDHVRRVNDQLDRLQLYTVQRVPSERPEYKAQDEHQWHATGAAFEHDTVDDESISPLADPTVATRVGKLNELIRSLNTSKSGLPRAGKVREILLLARDNGSPAPQSEPGVKVTEYELELYWILLAKATAQTGGLIFSAILEQTVPLSSHMWYWDEVLESVRGLGLYSIQTAPLRLWTWTGEVWNAVKQRRRDGQLLQTSKDTGAEGWRQFYGLVTEVVRERKVVDFQKRVISPLAMLREEVRGKRIALQRLKSVGTNALGVLLGEGLHVAPDGYQEEVLNGTMDSPQGKELREKWQYSVVKCISLMDAILRAVSDPSLGAEKFEETIASSALEHEHNEPPESRDSGGTQSFDSFMNIEHLLVIHDERLPAYNSAIKEMVRDNGRPPRIIRYWLPAAVLLVSSSTILRIAINRKAEVLTWIREFGQTVIDFWSNWVVEPSKKVIGTIRHDEGSEISIMSKRSLEGDRESLERMVVDFAVDNHNGGKGLTDADVAGIRAKVHDGDLTPVLRAYEKDVQSPFMGTVRGNLIRALLIQVQKTKVDVEVAIGGIDTMLKSQELVFGFIGLTPGILVCIGVGRWASGVLRNRTVAGGTHPTEFGELLYHDYGLLLCEVHILRESASKAFPRRVFREFLEELEELVDVRTGVEKQRKVVERILWAYAKWIR